MNELDLFAAALAVSDPAQRAVLLDGECAGQPALRERLNQLLDAHARSNPLLDRPFAGGPEQTGACLPSEQPGAIIAGRYKLLEAIGEGGMGAVWVAEQTEPVKRKVALKLIKAGMDSKSVLARFEAERQALAVMDHPNIAKVLDGGLTDTGRPFFVMEYVKGVSITEYCDATRLSVLERLKLFVQVCQAVQHAHQKGIIHRDLKPSNILVAPYDDKPVPKVIDFGLAKAMHQSLTERTLHTAHETVLGTPLYMSPEQAQLNNLDVDTRSDIYSLGVLLYELLTGTTPLEKQSFKEAAWEEIKRLIREEEPPRPSTRLSSSTMLPSLAAGRQMEPARLTKLVRGELDWIVMKALEKDRARRYETANGFAMDIQHYLAEEPVLAAPPSARYRLRKFARKHRAALTTAAAIGLFLVAGVAVSTWQAVRATRAESVAVAARDAEAEQRAAAIAERDEKEKARAAEADQRQHAEAEKQRADEEAAIAKAVNDFLQNDLLAEAAPEKNARAKKVTVEEVLERAAARIAGKFNQQPRIEAAIRLTIGDTYHQLGDYTAAQPHLERALEVRRRVLGKEHDDTLNAMNNLAMLYKDQGQLAKAEPLDVEALEVSRRVNGEEHPHTLIAMNNLAALYIYQGQFAKAEPLYVKAVEAGSRVLGPEHIDTLTAMNNLAVLYQHQSQFAKAEPLYVRILEVSRRVLGEEHPNTLGSMNNLALLYWLQGQHAKAEPLYVEALEVSRRVEGEEHPHTLSHMYNLAVLYRDQGQLAKSEPLGRELLEKVRRIHGEPSPLLARALASLGSTLLKQQKYAEAEPLLRERLALHEKQEPDDWLTFNTKSMLGGALLGQKKYADAEPLLLASYEGMKQREKSIPAQGKNRLTEAVERLVQLYEATGKTDEAAKWRKELESMQAVQKKTETQLCP